MHEEGRVPYIDGAPKALEAFVAEVGRVVAPRRRRVGEDHVRGPAKEGLRTHPQHPPPHLPFRVLKEPVSVPPAPVEPGKPDATVVHDPSFNVLEPVVRRLLVCLIVVAPHVEDGHVERSGQEVQVVRRQVARRENQVDGRPALRIEMVVEDRTDGIGDGENGESGGIGRVRISFPGPALTLPDRVMSPSYRGGSSG
jgi:hypothetical protein